MKNALLVLTVAITLTGCANADSSAPEHTTSPTTSASEEMMQQDALYVSTIKKGTTGVIADEPKQLSAGVPNVTTDGRTALDVTIQGEGAYGIVYLSDGENFEIDGIPSISRHSRRARRSPYTSYAANRTSVRHRTRPPPEPPNCSLMTVFG